MNPSMYDLTFILANLILAFNNCVQLVMLNEPGPLRHFYPKGHIFVPLVITREKTWDLSIVWKLGLFSLLKTRFSFSNSSVFALTHLDSNWCLQNSGHQVSNGSCRVVQLDLWFQSCDDRNIANKMCEDCDEYLCDDCVKAHKRVKVTKDHVIKDVTIANVDDDDESSTLTKDVNCSVHQVTRISFEADQYGRVTGSFYKHRP